MGNPEPQCEASSIGGTSIKHEEEKSMGIRQVEGGFIVVRSEFRYGDRARDEVYLTLDEVVIQVRTHFLGMSLP